MLTSRKPDYSLGRFFVSPILGCKAHCSYCYIFSEGYTSRIVRNNFTIDESIRWILDHAEYHQGNTGSILSVGAWGDPFPPKDDEAIAYTLCWIKKLCELGNPLQLISRFALHNSTIEEISSYSKYKNQILFSTSISTFRSWQEIEPNTDPPIDRLKTLSRFLERGIPANLMIKPFLNGITNLEVEDFTASLLRFNIKYCVVGSLHWNEDIREFMRKTERGITVEMLDLMEEEERLQLFDCTSEKKMYTYHSSLLDEFIAQLELAGVNVFKKSSCVNSHILQAPNVSLFYEDDPNNFCVKCGVCDVSAAIK
jgi:DNA repair photolyase